MNNIKYKVFDLVEKRDAFQNQVDGLVENIKILNQDIKNICHHPRDYIEEKKYYFDGSYYDKAYTEYWCECKICGSKSEIIYHGYYG